MCASCAAEGKRSSPFGCSFPCASQTLVMLGRDVVLAQHRGIAEVQHANGLTMTGRPVLRPGQIGLRERKATRNI